MKKKNAEVPTMQLVRKTENGYETDDMQAALKKLAALEALCEQTQARQTELSARMAELRAKGKEKSVQFRELLAEKLTNSAVLSALSAHGLLD